MPIFTNPEIQKFVAQQTGVDPGAAVRSMLPSAPALGYEVPQFGTSPITYQMGQSAYDSLKDKQFLKPLGAFASNLGVSNGRSAALTALALGLGGAGFGLMTGRNPVTTGLMGAGVGAAAGYGLSALTKAMDARRQFHNQNRRLMYEAGPESRKSASQYYGADDPSTYVQSRLFSDTSLGSAEKAMLMSSLRVLPQAQMYTLADLLRTAGGSAIGYLIAKFLLNAGSMGQALGAVGGGLMGMYGGSRPPHDTFGQSMDPGTDVFGRMRFVQ